MRIHQLSEQQEFQPGYRVQMMSYILEGADGSLAVIDGGMAGDADYLLEYLQQLAGAEPQVSLWFISHIHEDHYGALGALLASGRAPKIGKVIWHFPSEAFLRAYARGSVEGALAFRNAVLAAEIPAVTPNAGEKFSLDDGVLTVIYDPGEKFTENQTNNGSVVLRLDSCGQSVLFPGDLGIEAGEDLVATVPEELVRADVVQMAHHGQNGTTRRFYETVSPRACLWPTPWWLWDNNLGNGFDTHGWQTVEVRRWMQELGVRHHVVSKDGTAVLTLPLDFDAEWGIRDAI